MANGGPWGGGWDGGWYGGWWNPDDIRQFRREFRERQTEAEELRRQLTEAGVRGRELTDLEAVLNQLRMLYDDRLYADPNGLAQLQASAIERLKKFEFDLRKKVDSTDQQLFLSGSDEVPAGFRQAIEEYYRSLAKKIPPQADRR